MQIKRIKLVPLFIVLLILHFSKILYADAGRIINFRSDTTLEQVKVELKVENKLGLLYFRGEHCGWCIQLEKEVFTNDTVRTYIETTFVSFKSGHNLSKHYKIFGVPCTIIIDSTGEVIDKIMGYYPSNVYLKQLKRSIKPPEKNKEKIAGKTFKDLKNAYETNPDDKEAAWEYVQKLFETGDHDNAIPIYEALATVTLSDSSAEVWKLLNLGECYEQKFKYEKAIDCYKKVLESGYITKENQKIRAHTKLGELCYWERRYESSIQSILMLPTDLNKIEDIRSRHNAIRIHPYLAFSLARLGKYDEGKNALIKYFQELMDTNGGWTLSDHISMCISNNLYLKEALPWAKKGMESHIKMYNAALKNSESADKSEEREKSKKEAERLLDGCFPVCDVYAQLSSLNGDYNTAIETWKIMLLYPDSYNGTYYKERGRVYLAGAYLKSGKTEEGDSLINDILKNYPKDSALFWLPLMCKFFKIKLKEAIKWSEEGLTIKLLNENMWLVDAYAELLYETGEIEKAIEWEKKAYEKWQYYRFRDNLDKYEAALKK